MLTSRSYPFILLLFQFCSGCPASVLVSEQTPICLKPHRRTIKKKKFIAVFLIPSNHNSNPQEVSAAISLHHQQRPHHTGDFQFRCLAPHNNDPAFNPPSAHLLQSKPDHFRRPASPILILIAVAPPEALHLVRHCQTKLQCRSNQSSLLFLPRPITSLT